MDHIPKTLAKFVPPRAQDAILRKHVMEIDSCFSECSDSGSRNMAEQPRQSEGVGSYECTSYMVTKRYIRCLPGYRGRSINLISRPTHSLQQQITALSLTSLPNQDQPLLTYNQDAVLRPRTGFSGRRHSSLPTRSFQQLDTPLG